MTGNKISTLSKILLGLASIFLVVSIFIPIWRIELNAPQYPEGLILLIYATKLGGNVDIINGLNHYIGMQTLHAENFIEFTILAYIIGFFALFSLVSLFIGRKKLLYILMSSFILFGIIAMVDFWRWEYNYGHNLDPKAAIIVPGMAYQPPLIGFKQLLNFGAYSIPDMGGWLFIGSGLLMLVAVILETKIYNKLKGKKKRAFTLLLLPISLLIISCSSGKPDPIKLNKDNCDFCKMTISDGKFGCELITKKGRIYKFDDIGCMMHYKKENPKLVYQAFYVSDYGENNVLIPADAAFYVRSIELKSPMGGNIAAFNTKDKADTYAKHFSTQLSNWKQINP